MTMRLTVQATVVALVLLLGISGRAFAGAAVPQNANETLVLRAMTELFSKRNTGILKELWAEDYRQHNPDVADGRDQLVDMINALPASFTYEPGFITSNADIVMIHGRYTGLGPKPFVIVDIFRVKDGRLSEHWDVTQEEVPASGTKSGNPMFEPAEGR